MKQALASGDIQLTRSLGQNFLHDQNQLRRIVAAAELNDTDKVLEVGPGLGPLTALLIEQAGEVLAIEKDRRLVDFLRSRYGAESKLKLLHEDALQHIRHEHRDWSDWKVVSNLPYSVGSAILVELAEAPGCPKRIVATVQIEVAERIMAQAATEEYGILTLLMQLRYLPKGSFKIPAACFFPEPAVDSACVILERRPEALLPAPEATAFTRIVKRAFSQRRKMMLKLLKNDWPAAALTSGFDRAQIPATARAEEVTLSQFVHLTQHLANPHE